MKPFFLVGNKRSGTTLLGRLLNMHPNIFCSRESDAAWILYRMARDPLVDPEETVPDSPGWITSHPLDDDYGMRSTLSVAAHLFRGGREDPKAAFERVQLHLMRHGSKVQPMFPMKVDVISIGDQKPVQNAEPDVRHWVDWRFEDVQYLHMVRHPMHCISSMSELGFNPWWRGSLEEVERIWVQNEKRATAIPSNRRLSFRYEDLLVRPVSMMERIYAHLGHDMPSLLAHRIRDTVRPQDNRRLLELPYTPELLDVMGWYGYSPLSPKGGKIRIDRLTEVVDPLMKKTSGGLTWQGT